jgi:hypothetical protein
LAEPAHRTRYVDGLLKNFGQRDESAELELENED